MRTQVTEIYTCDEAIQIWQWGPNDFEVDYIDQNISFRGTLMEAMQDLQDNYGYFDK